MPGWLLCMFGRHEWIRHGSIYLIWDDCARCGKLRRLQ